MEYGGISVAESKIENRPVLLPVRAEGPDGIIGDGAVEIWPGHPDYEQQKAEIERLNRILNKPGRTAR